MTVIKVLRVFTNSSGNYGNPVGVVIDIEQKLSAKERQRIATASGFSEMVFVNDLANNSISIYSPRKEVAFAGHAVVGVVSFLERTFEKPVTKVLGSKGTIDSWSENGLTWVKAELRITPLWWHERLASVEELVALAGPQTDNQDHVQLWAWIDESKGIIRSRTFAPAWGIPEDEANGSGCMRLAATLGRSLVIHHGEGSVIHARPSVPGYAEVGGTVTASEDIIL